MKTCVEFHSDRFPPHVGEEEQTNPGRWGKRLADFLATELAAKGFRPRPAIAEDWGWLIPIENEPFPLAVACGRYGDEVDGFLCFIEPHESSTRRWLRQVDTTGPVTGLARALDEILSAGDGIRDVRWSTHDEFNGG